MKRSLLCGKIVRRDNTKQGAILIENGIILDSDYHGDVPENTKVTDFGERYILPGFVELHAHGGGGDDFGDCTAEAFTRICDLHLSHGVTRICPTLTACDWESTLTFLRLCKNMRTHPMFAGAHLEGPFLSPKMSGAQNTARLRLPNEKDAETLCSYGDVISRITLAPELAGADDFARRLLSAGIALSIGHSDADADTVRRAVVLGYTQVTHLYCSTASRRKKGSYVVGGLVEAALTEDALTVELIGDGHHICRESFLLTMRCKGADGVCVVSDAMRAAGQTDVKESYLGAKQPENRVIIEDGVAKLPDRSSFAGSVAAGDTMVNALCGRYGIDICTVSGMMSRVPSRLLYGKGKYGEIASGFAADLAVLDTDYKTYAVYLDGKRVR